MPKPMEKMTKAKVLEEFETKPEFEVPRREGNMSVLTIRVHPDLKMRLEEEAKRRGITGHTTMARLLIEEGLKRSSDNEVRRAGPKGARKALQKLREAEKEVERIVMAFASK